MIPNGQEIVARLAQEFPQEWRTAHNPSGGGPETEAFIRRVAWVLHSTVDAKFGLNGKRGNYNDVSDDVVNWIGEGPGNDPATGQPVTVIDVIGGAGGPDPRPQWGIIDLPGPGGWIKPSPVGGAQPAPVSSVWTAAHDAIRARMVGRSALEVAQQLAYTFPDEQWGEKRTASGPWSQDTIGRLVGGRLWVIKLSPVTIHGFVDGQVHRPVQGVNHLGDSVPVPVPVPVPPPVPPAEPASHLAEVLSTLNLITTQLAQLSGALADIRPTVCVGSPTGGTTEPGLKASVDALNDKFDRGFDVEGKGGWPIGSVKGRISLRPKTSL